MAPKHESERDVKPEVEARVKGTRQTLRGCLTSRLAPGNYNKQCIVEPASVLQPG